MGVSRVGSGGKGGSDKAKLAAARWLWRAPLRALGRARDLYVRSLNGCAGLLPPDAAAFGCPSSSSFACSRRHHQGDDEYYFPSSSSFSRSFSASSSSFSSSSRDGDLRELVRAASERRAAERVPPPAAAVARSRSVAMARIDEDRPCEFGGLAGSAGVAFGRSRSCAVAGGGGSGLTC